jgi:hypothetical protein
VLPLPVDRSTAGNKLRRWTKSKERILLKYVTACLITEVWHNCVLGSDITHQHRCPQQRQHHSIPNLFTQNVAKSGRSEVNQPVAILTKATPTFQNNLLSTSSRDSMFKYISDESSYNWSPVLRIRGRTLTAPPCHNKSRTSFVVSNLHLRYDARRHCWASILCCTPPSPKKNHQGKFYARKHKESKPPASPTNNRFLPHRQHARNYTCNLFNTQNLKFIPNIWLRDIYLFIKANSHMPCRAHAVPLPCRAALIHTCHAAPLPFSNSAVSFVKVRVVTVNIRSASPTV